MHTGAIILCGGESKRMGRDKASLPFGRETMLQWVVRLAGEVVANERIVVVAAPQQILSGLPNGVIAARDAAEYLGPLAGLATGLQALSKSTDIVDAVYVTGCDFPLLVPAFVERMFSLLDNFDAAVPLDGDQRHVLAAVYRPDVLTQVEELLARGQRRLQSLLDDISVREVSLAEMCAVDPSLNSLRNVNSDADYVAALKLAGITVK